MQPTSIYGTKFRYYYYLLKDALETKKPVKIYDNYYEIHNMRLESARCYCCGAKYIDIFIDGVVYRPYGSSLSCSSDSMNDCLSNSSGISGNPKYKRYKFWGPLSAYYIMCEFNEASDNHRIKEFVFKCQYGNGRFDHRIVSEKDVQIVDEKFEKELSDYIIVSQ